MRLSENATLQTVPVETMETISIPLIEYARKASIFYFNCTALLLNTVILHPYLIMPPYSQHGQVISTGMTLQTLNYSTVRHPHSI